METAELVEIRNILRPYGLDLAAYTDSFLQRRILIRMRGQNLVSMKDYAALLTKDSEERRKLTELLSVTVTEFFRDAMFTAEILDPVFARIAAKVTTRPIAAWSAGCATGQEPYSLSFLLDAYLSAKGRRAGFKLQATDISDINLKVAAAGVYSKAIVAAMPAQFHKYFEPFENQMRVVQPIRDLILFQKADLCEKPPFSGLDLILCRNVMIYLTPETKKIILTRFHGAMNPAAVLVLGAAEVILEPTLFKPLDTRHKIYEKI